MAECIVRCVSLNPVFSSTVCTGCTCLLVHRRRVCLCVECFLVRTYRYRILDAVFIELALPLLNSTAHCTNLT